MTTPEQPEQIDREAANSILYCAIPDSFTVHGQFKLDLAAVAEALAAHRRLGIEQGKRMVDGKVEAIKRELAERTRYAMGILADLREVVDLGDESSESVLGYCDDLETTVHNIAAVASHLPTEQRKEG